MLIKPARYANTVCLRLRVTAKQFSKTCLFGGLCPARYPRNPSIRVTPQGFYAGYGSFLLHSL